MHSGFVKRLEHVPGCEEVQRPVVERERGALSSRVEHAPCRNRGLDAARHRRTTTPAARATLPGIAAPRDDALRATSSMHPARRCHDSCVRALHWSSGAVNLHPCQRSVCHNDSPCPISASCWCWPPLSSVLAAASSVIIARLGPRLRAEVVRALESRMDAAVTLETFEAHLWPRPGVSGGGLTLRHRQRPDLRRS